MAGNKFLKALAGQFGLSTDAIPDPNAPTADPLTPEERRQAEIELQATLRGKIVAQRPRVTARDLDAGIGDAPAPVSGASPVGEDGSINFAALYAQAQVPPAKFTAEQALDIIKDCEPTDAARKQTIKVIATFGKNVGATPDEIVVDAADKQDALHSFLGARDDELAVFSSKADEQVAALLARAEQIKQMKQAAMEQHARVQAACREEAARLEQVKDFFRQEVSLP